MKQEIRKISLAKRDLLSLEQREEKSRRIMQQLYQSPLYRQAKQIFSYFEMRSEVITSPFLAQALSEGKTVALPVSLPERQMYFVPIQSFAELKTGRFGVKEPPHTPEKAILPQAGDLFIVPGSVFDRSCHRFGYGGGYYDTYLEQKHGFHTIGIGFHCQLSETPLPIEAHDLILESIITESEWIWRDSK